VTALATVVDTSQRVGSTPARLAKVRELAALLGALLPEEIGIASHYLAGEIPQGRIGIGYATLAAAADAEPPATQARRRLSTRNRRVRTKARKVSTATLGSENE